MINSFSSNFQTQNGILEISRQEGERDFVIQISDFANRISHAVTSRFAKPVEGASSSAASAVVVQDGAQLSGAARVNNPYEGTYDHAVSVKPSAFALAVSAETAGEKTVEGLPSMLNQLGFSNDEINQRGQDGANMIDQVSRANGLRNPNLIDPDRGLKLPSKSSPHEFGLRMQEAALLLPADQRGEVERMAQANAPETAPKTETHRARNNSEPAQVEQRLDAGGAYQRRHLTADFGGNSSAAKLTQNGSAYGDQSLATSSADFDGNSGQATVRQNGAVEGTDGKVSQSLRADGNRGQVDSQQNLQLLQGGTDGEQSVRITHNQGLADGRQQIEGGEAAGVTQTARTGTEAGGDTNVDLRSKVGDYSWVDQKVHNSNKDEGIANGSVTAETGHASSVSQQLQSHTANDTRSDLGATASVGKDSQVEQKVDGGGRGTDNSVLEANAGSGSTIAQQVHGDRGDVTAMLVGGDAAAVDQDVNGVGQFTSRVNTGDGDNNITIRSKAGGSDIAVNSGGGRDKVEIHSGPGVDKVDVNMGGGEGKRTIYRVSKGADRVHLNGGGGSGNTLVLEVPEGHNYRLIQRTTDGDQDWEKSPGWTADDPQIVFEGYNEVSTRSLTEK